MNFGTPSLAACVADGTAPKLPAGCSWVALPPDALTSARIAAGQVVLVGITSRVLPQPALGGSAGLHGPAGGGRSPGAPLPASASASAFGPAPELLAPEPHTGLPPQPLSLWRLCAGRLGFPALRGPGEPGDGGRPPAPGAYLLPARVWPAARLPRAAALLSPALRESAGQPPAGTVVLLYRPSAVVTAGPATHHQAAAAAALPASITAAAAAAEAAAAPAEAITPLSAAAAASAVHAGAAAAAGSVSVWGSGGAVVLRLCGEALLQPPLGAAAAAAAAAGDGGSTGAQSELPGGGGGGGGGRAPLASPVGTPAGKGPRAGAGAGAENCGRSPAAASPAAARGKAAAAAAAGGDAAAAGGPLQQWPLDTLRRAADAGDEATRTALAAVARRHLAGRHVLAGAPLVLPVLGSSALFRVVAAVSASHGSGGGGAATSATPVEVCRSTQVVVVFPQERLPEQFVCFAAEPGDQVAADADAGTGTGTGTGTGIPRRVAVAREAAAAAVAESAAEAAADAAERALRAGLSTGGVDYSQLGGVGPHRNALRELVGLPLRAPHLFAQYGIRPPRGVLLYGPPGSGKTVLARAAAADAGATVFVINGPDVVSEYYGESEASLKGIFAAAAALAPSLVLMDEVDALAPARPGGGGYSAHTPGEASGGSDVASRLVTALLTLMDGAEEHQHLPHHQQGRGEAAGGATASPSALGPCSSYRPVVVVAATNRPDALDPALRRPGRLEREIEVGVPGAAARLEILEARLRSVRHALRPPQLAALAASAHGFVSADLAALVDEAAMCALRRRVAEGQRRRQGGRQGGGGQADSGAQEAAGCGGSGGGAPEVTLEDFKTAETRVRPSALREVAVEIPAVRWDDIGGLHPVKQALREAVEWPTRAGSAMARLGAQAPRGVLLYGPPGCSKTLLARAVASEAGLNFLSVKGGELVGKYVGESEKAVAGLFARARATAPSIIFFDELDGLVGSRGGPEEGGTAAGVSARLLSQLLTEMDGLRDRGGVTVLGATNRPDCLDPALLRPGRFDRLIHVPLPDKDARAEILRVQLRRCPVAADVDVGLLAVHTAGYSGADLAAVVQEAGLAALEEDLGSEQVALRHFEAALRLVGPSVEPSSDMMAMYGRMQRAAVSAA